MKKSDRNLAVIQNFILHITHSSIPHDRVDGEDEYATTPMTFTPDELYQMAEDYIQEDHVDGRDNEEDHIVTYGAESSFHHEDKDKEYPECVIVVADFGDDVGTATVASIDSTDVDGVNELIEFIRNPTFP
jgi:hypothetical protein